MNKQESQYEKGMKALASMGHVQKLTAIEGKTLRLKIFYEISNSYHFQIKFFRKCISLISLHQCLSYL